MDHTHHPSLQLLDPAAQDTLSNSHSTLFQPLLHRLLMAFCEEQVIPAMTAEEVRRVVYLSRFHDIGKQSLPRSIIQKGGKLTLEERRILQQHPALGVRLLRSIPALRQYPYYDVLCDICLHHHERWDGGGYPDGLTGRHITPYVHVVAMADAYDALRTARPYKPPLSHSEAMSMLCGGACGAFNPEMIACLREIPGTFFAACYGEACRVG
ncbi:HD domain-containing phosphohydrolase [Flavonifractor sp. An306]|uniref:HD-GYP domain-containing protein n=1 Tax=Flavonifractor sp. An306 TaxID=1965629 RepID=UPI000B39B1F8|nr:HD domain-containing phosphohydrolase [Flavonifractor sp. An306]OUO34607.1 hypothetical protein B5F88_15640 [Flavonifractor sp. An306]